MKDFLLNFFGALSKTAFLPQMKQLLQNEVNQRSFIFFFYQV